MSKTAEVAVKDDERQRDNKDLFERCFFLLGLCLLIFQSETETSCVHGKNGELGELG